MRKSTIAFAALFALVRCTNSATNADREVAGRTATVDPGSSGQLHPAVAYDGGSYLLVWQDPRGSNDIYGARISRDGQPLQAGGFAIASGSARQREPAVAFDGVNYLVVWADDTADAIRGARVTPGGAVLDRPGLSISQSGRDAESVAIAFNGTAYLVVWKDDPSNKIYAALVSPSGTVGAPLTVSASPGVQSHPAVTSDGAGFLVAWTETRTGSSPDVLAARVSAAGAVLDATPIAIAVGDRHQESVAAAFGGGVYLLAWSDASLGSPWDIRARRVSSAGVVLDGPAIQLAQATAVAHTLPAVAFDGTSFAVAWEDQRTGARDLYAAEVSPAGAVVRNGVALASSADGEAGPALGTDAADRVLLAYEDTDPTPATRIAVRSWTLRATVTVERTGRGAGTVVSSPAGIACGIDCATTFVGELPVTLTATPEDGFIFAGWEGACEAFGTEPCVVQTDDDRAVVARFEYPPWPLTVKTAGYGAGGITGTGISCTSGSTAGCNALVPNTLPSTVVALTAVADDDSFLASWAGCNAVTDDVCSVTMSGAKTVTATFQPKFWTITARTAGVGAGTITGEGMSCTSGSTASCTAKIPNTTPATVATLTATPDADSLFISWSGCATVTDNVCTLPVSGYRTVTATFQPRFWGLTVRTSGSGAGTVTGQGDASAISCATPGGTSGCSTLVANTNPSTEVTLTAAPAASSLFAGWSGCTATDGVTCTVTMAGARTVTATFQPTTWVLTAKTSGNGVGTLTGGGIGCTTGSTAGCTANVPNTSPATDVTITAAPDANSILTGWSGCTISEGNSCTVSMTGARTVTATFQPAYWVLTGKTSGLGGGTITGAGLSCTTGSSAGCTVSVANTNPATEVTVTATPNASSLFVSWSGCTISEGTTCTVSMASARTITATFQPSTWVLTAKTSGTGVGTITGAGLSCTSGSTASCTAAIPNTDPATDVTVTATPDANSIFTGWSGCSTSSERSCTVTMAGARTVTASFMPSTWLLTVRTNGTGGGTVTGGGITCTSGTTAGCTAPVPNTTPATEVTLTATPNASSIFAGWSGCTTTSGGTCTVAVSNARTVYATFQPSTWLLTVKTTGTGVGTVTGGGIGCTSGSTAGCTAAIPNTSPATEVTLTAAPNATSIFAGWSNCPNPSGDTCTVPVAGARTVYAQFQPSTWTLTVRVNGNGSGTIDGPGISCTTGSYPLCTVSVPNTNPPTSYVVTAAANAGSVFAGWTACSEVAGNACTVYMMGSVTATATFTLASTP